MKIIEKPKGGEFAPYASMYIDLLPDDGLVLRHLKENFEAAKNLILPLQEEKLLYQYAVGKWTIKEILAHIIDDERIYCYRALRFARKDKTPLPGFEQNDYVPHSSANGRDLSNIFAEYEAVRNSTIAFYNGLEDAALQRAGVADGNPMSVRASAYHIAGHELHHINFIKKHYLE